MHFQCKVISMKVTTLLPTIPSHALLTVFHQAVLSKHLSEEGKGGGSGLGRSWSGGKRKRETESQQRASAGGGAALYLNPTNTSEEQGCDS